MEESRGCWEGCRDRGMDGWREEVELHIIVLYMTIEADYIAQSGPVNVRGLLYCTADCQLGSITWLFFHLTTKKHIIIHGLKAPSNVSPGMSTVKEANP